MTATPPTPPTPDEEVEVARTDGAAVAAEAEVVAGEAEVVAAPRTAQRIGIALFCLAVAGLIALAAIGFTPALYLLVLAVVGVGLVILGTRMH